MGSYKKLKICMDFFFKLWSYYFRMKRNFIEKVFSAEHELYISSSPADISSGSVSRIIVRNGIVWNRDEDWFLKNHTHSMLNIKGLHYFLIFVFYF